MVKWKVYISSTFLDLKEYRAGLINLFQNELKDGFELSHIMERMFADGSYTPFVDDCKNAVAASDIYIIILGNKTGSFPPGESRTYTEIEFDTAINFEPKKKIFCFTLENFKEDQIDNKEKHEELLKKFKGNPKKEFRDFAGLKTALYDSLLQFTRISPINPANPYKGLESFKIEDGDYFFGRNREIEECLQLIVNSEGNFFISIIGNSGIGKSSFVQAGLLFQLRERKELGYADSIIITFSPGSTPFSNLKYQLLAKGFSLNQDWKIQTNKTENLILYLDQFEEIITQCYTAEAKLEREKLIEFLDSIRIDQNSILRVLVIFSFRIEYLSQLTNFDFMRPGNQSLFPLKSLDYRIHSANWETSMREITTKPAYKHGIEIEEELVVQLLDQLKEVDGVLPILQFALEKIWTNETIKDRVISASEFSKLSSGKGLSGIIETHARNIVDAITNQGKNQEKESIVKSIFVNLIEVNENRNDIRRTVPKEELLHLLWKKYLKTSVNEVWDQLINESRLISLSSDGRDHRSPTQQQNSPPVIVSIVHEELVRKWDTLRIWIDARRDALAKKKHMLLDIKAYEKNERQLYKSRELKNAKAWARQNPDIVNDKISDFLTKSQKEVQNSNLKAGGILIIILFLTVIFNFWILPEIERKHFINQINTVANYSSLKEDIEDAGGLDSLKSITINETNLILLTENIKFLPNLNSIKLNAHPHSGDLSFLKELTNPSLIDSLHSLRLNSLEGLEILSGLKHLSTSNFNELINLKNLKNPEQLLSLEIWADSTENLNKISYLHNLIFLKISQNSSLKDLSGLEGLPKLRSLNISSNNYLKQLTGIRKLPKINLINIEGNDNLINIMALEEVPSLRSLKIHANYSLDNLDGIQKLACLTHLEISNMPSFYNLNGAEKLQNLRYLEISMMHQLENLSNLNKLKNLDSLSIYGSKYSKSNQISFIIDSLPISHLSIGSMDSLRNLNGIEKLPNLRSLVVFHNFNLLDLNGIEKSIKLNSLKIYGNQPFLDLSILEKLSELKVLEIDSIYNLDIELIKRNNPGIKIRNLDFGGTPID